MKCWHCNTELIWGSDFDGEDYGCEDIAIVTNLSCPKCHSIVEVYLPKDTEQLNLHKKLLTRFKRQCYTPRRMALSTGKTLMRL